MNYKDETDCPGCREAATWRKLVGQVRTIYTPGHWTYDAAIKKDIYVQGFFYSYISYGITSAWRGQ